MRDADELHDALLDAVVVPPRRGDGRTWFDELVAQRRATLTARTTAFWTCAERLASRGSRTPTRRYNPKSPRRRHAAARDREDAVPEIVRGWLESSGPTTIAELAERFGSNPTPLEPPCYASKPKAKCCAADSAATTPRNGATGACSREFTA